MEKVWLTRYPSDVPPEIKSDVYSSLVEMFENATQKYSDQAAFTNMGKVITFRKLEERSRAFAAYLQNDLGLKKGDRVAIMMPNLLQYPVALFGILRAGCVIVNVNPLYTPRELEHQLNDSEAKAIVIISNFASTLQQIIHKTSVRHVILSHLGDMLFHPKGTFVNFVVKYIKRMVPKYYFHNAIPLRLALRKGKKTQYVKPHLTGDDIAFLQYTGGTTGVSKGAILTHRNMLANLEQAKASYFPVLQKGRELVITALPLYHIFALTVNCLLFIELGGQNLLINNPRDIQGLIKEISHYPFTAITGVNTLFNALVNHPSFKRVNFSHLHLSVSGGTAVQQRVAEKWKEITGIHILEGYGLTECSPLVSAYPYDLRIHNGSIGVPVPSTDVRIVDDEGHILSFDGVGELQVKGPQVMQGYWKQPAATDEVLSKDGWLSTGDIVRFCEDGFLHIVDRKKDLIIVSGFNVYPNEIEDVVALNDKVLEVAAIGQAHERSGEQVKIFVVKKDETLTEKEIIEHCRQYLTGYKVPKIVEFRDDLPKSNIGKILRRQLRDEDNAQKRGPQE